MPSYSKPVMKQFYKKVQDAFGATVEAKSGTLVRPNPKEWGVLITCLPRISAISSEWVLLIYKTCIENGQLLPA